MRKHTLKKKLIAETAVRNNLILDVLCGWFFSSILFCVVSLWVWLMFALSMLNKCIHVLWALMRRFMWLYLCIFVESVNLYMEFFLYCKWKSCIIFSLFSVGFMNQGNGIYCFTSIKCKWKMYFAFNTNYAYSKCEINVSSFIIICSFVLYIEWDQMYVPTIASYVTPENFNQHIIIIFIHCFLL